MPWLDFQGTTYSTYFVATSSNAIGFVTSTQGTTPWVVSQTNAFPWTVTFSGVQPITVTQVLVSATQGTFPWTVTQSQPWLVTQTGAPWLVSALDEQGNKTQDSEYRSLFQIMVTELRAIRWAMQYLISQMEHGTGGGGGQMDLIDIAQDTLQEEVTN